MKRLYVSYILIFLTIVICYAQFSYVVKSCDEFGENINTIEKLYTNGNLEEANELCDTTLNKWNKKAKYSDIFLHHDYVDAITTNLDELRIMIKNRENKEVLTLCSEIKNQFLTLRKSEMLTAENII